MRISLADMRHVLDWEVGHVCRGVCLALVDLLCFLLLCEVRLSFIHMYHKPKWGPVLGQ